MYIDVGMFFIFVDNMSHADGFDSKKKKLLSEYDVDTQCLHPEQPKININPFEIFKDESEAQEEGKNYSFCASQPERKAGNFGIFRDETEVMGQMQNCSGNLSVPAQQKSQFAWTFGDNVQILHNERRENLISEPAEAINENCPFNYFKDENISPDTGNDRPYCPHIYNCNCEDTLNSKSFPCSHIKNTVDSPVSFGKWDFIRPYERLGYVLQVGHIRKCLNLIISNTNA